MSQSRPLFVYFHPFLIVITISIIQVEKSVNLNVNKGNVLEVKIVSMAAGGNMFTGKQMAGSAKATYYQNGVKVKTQVFNRTSGGGVMGAYKGACSILERVTTVLGKDIAKWTIDQKAQ